MALTLSSRLRPTRTAALDSHAGECDETGRMVAPHISLRHGYRIGMPQLGPVGLSENWLLKEGGARHWDAIAQALGCPAAAIHDRRGNRLYASFVALHLTGSGLACFQEDDEAVLTTRLYPLSRSRHYSLHSFEGPRSRLRLAMISVFVRKDPGGGNRRLTAEDISPTAALPPRPVPLSARLLLDDHRRLKIHDLAAEDGYDCAALCPATDFNGAGLLYFANYINFIDRAEWFANRPAGLERTCTLERKVFFFGNAGQDDRIRTGFRRTGGTSQPMETESILRRLGDGRKIAHAFTIRGDAGTENKLF